MDFLLLEKLQDNKTNRQIATDYIRFIKTILQVFKDADVLLDDKFGSTVNIKNYNSKICKNYLALYNIKIPNKLKDKHDSTCNCQKLMKGKKTI